MALAIGSIVWGVGDISKALRFWSEALNYTGFIEPKHKRAILRPRDGSGAQVTLRSVSSDSETHQRHHLDLYANNVPAEVNRLLQLGAERVHWQYEKDADYVVLSDPDGNRFCVIETPSRF